MSAVGFQQEYKAAFLEDSAGVFRHVEAWLLVMDATGIGDPVYNDLRHAIPRIEPVKLTNLSKTQLIQRLVVAVEQRQIG